MGIEKVSRTAKIDPENDIWIEGMRQNVFPWLSRSAAINEILTTIRLAFEGKDLPVTQGFWQELNRKYRVQGSQRVEGVPIVTPQKSETLKAKAKGAA